MVSEFRKKKLLYLYNNFFDTDKSGSVNKKDFDSMLQRIAKNKGLALDDPQLKRAKEGLDRIWNLLQGEADTDNDGEVSKAEWIVMWDNYTKNTSTSSEWQELFCKNVFSLVDSGKDGAIDENEFTKYYGVYSISKEDAAKAFQKASGGKGSITYEEYQELWKQFFLTEDQDAPGNYIFGLF